MTDYGWEPVDIPKYKAPEAPGAPPPPEKDWKYYLQTYAPIAVAGVVGVYSGNPAAAGLAYGATQTMLSPLTEDADKEQQQVAQGTQIMAGSYPYYHYYEQKNPSLPTASNAPHTGWWSSWEPGLGQPQQAAQPSSEFTNFGGATSGALGQPLSLHGEGGYPAYQPTKLNLNP